MSDPLVEEGWRWPERPGPRPLIVAALLALACGLLAAWHAWPAGGLAERDQSPRIVSVRVTGDGVIRVDGARRPAELRSRGDVRFLVARARMASDRPLRVRLESDVDGVIVRTLRPLDGDRGFALVEVPVHALDHVPVGVVDAGDLREITTPFDKAVRHARDARHLRDRVRDAWWWLAPLVLFFGVATPMMLWRSAAKRFHSMRRPGPGVDLGAAPPSSVDPIGAALLVAGCGRLDLGAAFAGHVLDLVERRQLPARRSVATPPGAGVLIGLHHIEDVDDIAATLLAAASNDDEMSIFLPDSTAVDGPQLAAADRRAWREHVASRAAFERLLDVARTSRLGFASAIGAIVALGMVGVGFVVGPGGVRAVAMLVGVLVALAAVTGVAWLRDALRWRVVARSRRVERAQWLAWRDAATTADGAGSDPRNLPLIAVVGASSDAIRAHASADAVDLAAVTYRTVQALADMAR